MGDTQRGKEKGQYNQWTPDETTVLIELLVEGIRKNWRDSSGVINKLTVEGKILPELNKRLGCDKNHRHYLSRLKFLKSLYQSYMDLQRFSSGFGWDPETKRFTAPDEVWKDYLLAHPTHKHMQNQIDHFEDLQIIFGSAVATGNFAVGMSDNTYQRVGERSQGTETVDENNEEVHELSSQQQSPGEHGTPFTLNPTTRRRYEKLIPRKKARTGGSNNFDETKSDHNDSMITVSNRILDVIQQREQRQQREAEKREENLKHEIFERREAEKRRTNVWDAMKEIPDLDEHIRYKAITLIHSLGMKDVFTDMSVEERFGWVKANCST